MMFNTLIFFLIVLIAFLPSTVSVYLGITRKQWPKSKLWGSRWETIIWGFLGVFFIFVFFYILMVYDALSPPTTALTFFGILALAFWLLHIFFNISLLKNYFDNKDVPDEPTVIIEQNAKAEFIKNLSVPKGRLRSDIILHYRPSERPAYDAMQLSHFLHDELPKEPHITIGTGMKLRDWWKRASTNAGDNKLYMLSMISNMMGSPIGDIKVSFRIPKELRNQHMHVLAKSGHGKTQLFETLLVDEMDDDSSVVVIDSQRDLIQRLATRVSLDRLILIDPESYPLPLNIFAKPAKTEAQINAALGLYEYIFSALDAKLTSQQTLVFRMLGRLCLAIPGANLTTFQQLLELKGVEPYAKYIPKLGSNAQSFFREYMQPKTNQYSETRQQVLRRITTILEQSTLAKMFNAPTYGLDMAGALDSGKIVLISTKMPEGAALFGRVFAGEVFQAVTNRSNARRRSYLFIDEFADYATDTPDMLNLFKQSRKYNLGMVVAHQELQDLPPALLSAVLTNTSIKFVGKVSASDRNKMAAEMRVEPELLDLVKTGEYTAALDGIGVYPYKVTFGALDAIPELHEYDVAVLMQAVGHAPQKPLPSSRQIPFFPSKPKPDDKDFKQAEKWQR